MSAADANEVRAGMADVYRPISCIEHERLEFAVLRRQRLWLRFRTGTGAECRMVVLPVDVFTRDGGEWLRYRGEDGVDGTLRLDHLLEATPA